MLPELLGQIAPHHEVARVTADGAYDTRKCHDAIAERGATAFGGRPFHWKDRCSASLPPRRNARPWKPSTAGAVARNEALRVSSRFGRALWRRWSGYHRRSRAETKMQCMKLLGQRLMARDFDRQVAEIHIRITVLNGVTALGTSITKAMG
ncbi:Transposase DDE domain-containing protein [Rubrimonas cliftonensis]|uniref:Transposase DDE domain-containing protein n=1 Tax=Rubrimonas cliftonensis TaxID=89524 RepID=A0A1H4GL16_9RHOB|nr:Transposase DDE domain-containing protein [Rubrimonas cliftonensis]